MYVDWAGFIEDMRLISQSSTFYLRKSSLLGVARNNVWLLGLVQSQIRAMMYKTCELMWL